MKHIIRKIEYITGDNRRCEKVTKILQKHLNGLLARNFTDGMRYFVIISMKFLLRIFTS